MKMRKFGRAGFQVSEMGFGAWPIGGEGPTVHYGSTRESDAFNCLAEHVEKGGNFIDTARAYNNSETFIGRFLKREGIRARMVVASKTGKLEEPGIRADLEKSLTELQCDTIDLYYLHGPPEDPDSMNRVLDVFDKLKNEGRIRAVGASIKGPNVTQATTDLCRQYIRSGRVDALQVIYSILRQKNSEMFDEAREAGVAIVARTVLENGFLTGKYGPGHVFSGQDHRRRFSDGQILRILKEAESLKTWAVVPPFEKLGQVAVRFVLDQPGLSSALVGAKTADQARENVAVCAMPALSHESRGSLVETYGPRCVEFNTT